MIISIQGKATTDMDAQRFGRYEVLGEIGRGSMGVVYRARDPLIEREVAIKTVPLGLGVDPSRRASYLSRLRREALAAGRLSHPNIVVVYDVGEEGESFYLAMELLRGQSLDKIIRSGRRFSPSDAAEILSPIAEALDHAHSKQVIHRDIKPSNLFITEDGTVKVTDFGIAKLPLTSLTGEGRIVGSPSYMSPEQVRGEPVDARSDVFSLGVVLYIVLTGKKPFGGGEVPDIVYRIVHEDPPPPSQIDMKLPESLDLPVIKALAKDPRMRYPSAGAMMRAVRESLQGAAASPRTRRTGGEMSAEDSTGEVRRPATLINRFRDEDSRDGFSKIEAVFQEITSEVRSGRLQGFRKKKKRKSK